MNKIFIMFFLILTGCSSHVEINQKDVDYYNFVKAKSMIEDKENNKITTYKIRKTNLCYNQKFDKRNKNRVLEIREQINCDDIKTEFKVVDIFYEHMVSGLYIHDFFKQGANRMSYIGVFYDPSTETCKIKENASGLQDKDYKCEIN